MLDDKLRSIDMASTQLSTAAAKLGTHGGPARAAALTSAQRSAIASKGGKAKNRGKAKPAARKRG